MYAPLGCVAPSAKCTAEPNMFGYFMFPSARHWDPAETPFAKTPSSRFLSFGICQGAAKGGRQKESDHFFSFSGHFRSLFGHFF